MGAIHKEKIEFTTSYEEFRDRVKLICSYKEIEWLGLEPKSISGMFFRDDATTLLRFCRENPSYHIVTITGPTRYENRFIADQRIYLLAQGDSNPQLLLNWSLARDFHLQLEEGTCQALAVIDDIKNGRQT
ncbi:MAG: hypothetical protein FJ146_16650 [Deltaproteobacteria bacterium]|nr:hypothetical protein [Deltaproteobacteria bacterium]